MNVLLWMRMNSWRSASLPRLSVYHKCNFKYTSKQTVSQVCHTFTLLENGKNVFFLFFFTCIHLEWDHLWTGFFKKTLQAQVKVQPPLTWCVHTRGWGFKKKQQNKTKKSLTTSSRACFWSGPLIDSHCSCSGSDLLAGNDPHIWTAEYIERSLGND